MQARRGGNEDRGEGKPRKTLRGSLLPHNLDALLEGPLVAPNPEGASGVGGGVGSSRRKRKRKSSGHPGSENQGSGTVRTGQQQLEEGKVPRTDRGRRDNVGGSGRGEHDAEGSGARGEISGQRPVEALGEPEGKREDEGRGTKRRKGSQREKAQEAAEKKDH